MPIKHLESVADLEAVLADSEKRPVMLFKHSTRCPISTAAEKAYLAFVEAHDDGRVLYTQLDLIQFREVSKAIAEKTGVRHQSPQAILLVDGEALWHASHLGITQEALAAAVSRQG